ncbi:MAG: RNA methyltransferase [Nitrospinae bacterium]|nr:RNA methyltransferase [Nitrospinota bacterium]
MILANTRHAGNIGAAARVMKNFGLARLTLVNPTARAHLEAVKMAPGSEEVIERAQVLSTLEEALEPLSFSYAATRRPRRLKKPSLGLMEAARDAHLKEGDIGLVFGSEKFGLSNEDAGMCDAFITIPSDPGYPSLNLAQSVAVTLYEFLRDEPHGAPRPEKKGERLYPTLGEKEGFHKRLAAMLEMTGFANPGAVDGSSRKIMDIIRRGEPDSQELKTLEGMLRKIRLAVTGRG